MDSSFVEADRSSSLLDSEEFHKEARRVIDFIVDYYQHIEDYPVLSPVEPSYLRCQLPEIFPTSSESLEAILLDVRKKIIPGLTHWQNPNFFAYLQNNASTAGFLGEMLCNGSNVVGNNWVLSPAAAELENIVMDWMAQMLKLPPAFMFPTENSTHGGGGVLHGSTCEAIVCSFVAARDGALSRVGFDDITKLVVYGSDQTHSTLEKGSRIVGIKPQNFRSLPTSSATGYSLQPAVVKAAMADDVAKGLIPFYLCATIGTTDGVERADSVSMNPHKWFLTNMDCCCLWLKDTTSFVSALSTNPEYLKNSATESKTVVDYKDWQIALSRRFRAIKLWPVIRLYGTDKLREHIRSDVGLAMVFEELVREDERFETVAPRRFAMVCFGLKANEKSVLNHKVLQAVNSTGKLYMTHKVVRAFCCLLSVQP
ncbi:unnamed protein product [Victoria cruziana]